MLIAQITDSHVEAPGVIAHGRYDARALLERALKQIATMVPKVDFILHTGDVTHHGDVSVNRDVRAMLEATGLPYAVIPGNHDETEPLREAYADKPWMPKSGFIHFVIDDFPARIICLDTKIPNEVAGTLCEERLAWLETQLKAGGSRPTMIAMHHPAFRIGRPFSDARPFGNADKFAEPDGALPERLAGRRRPRALHAAGADRQRGGDRGPKHGVPVPDGPA